MAAPDEREFLVFERGVVRDQIILAAFRNRLRLLKNPETGLTLTEDEIARATQPGSRFYIDADAIDLYGQAQQGRALFLSDQLDPRRAHTEILRKIWSDLWLGPDASLAAVGASGAVLAKGNPGTIFNGSTTVPDPAAVVGTDPNGFKYQVLETETVGPDGTATLALKGVDAGHETNLFPGTVITWSANTPLGSEPTAAVLEVAGQPGVGFSGGFDAETDAELADRVVERIRGRPASGNAAHFQAWARAASVAVEQAYVYSCALHAGSVVVSLTQRRSSLGPLARLPSVGVMADATNYLVPPGSPVVPERVFVLVVSPASQSSDLVVRVAMNAGVGGGWFDVVPWPSPPEPSNPALIEPVAIATVVTQLQFTITTAVPLPANATSLTGTDVPAIMLWNDATSRFEKLNASTITRSGTTVTVTLTSAPAKTIVAGDRISPYTDRLDVVAESLEQYFDSLGPGELVAVNDTRYQRAARLPRPSLLFPARAGQALVSVLVDNLGGTASDADLTRVSRTEPDLPASATDGPNLVTLGKVNVYPL